MDILLPDIAVQILVKVLGLTILAKISLHITVGVLICLGCHISIGLFMSAHISLSLNEILLALPIT